MSPLPDRSPSSQPGLDELLSLHPALPSAQRVLAGRTRGSARRGEEAGARSHPGTPGPGGPSSAPPLPRFWPRDRWCCRRRGRGPAGHPDDAQLRPRTALPFPRLPGGSRRQLRLRPAGSAGLEPRQPVHPRSEETDLGGPPPRPHEGGETDGRPGQCGGSKPALRGGASPPARPRPSLQGPSSAP